MGRTRDGSEDDRTATDGERTVPAWERDAEPDGGVVRDRPADDRAGRESPLDGDGTERTRPGDADDRTGPYGFEDVTVVMGTYDEEAAVASVLDDIDRVSEGLAEVVCVDSSSDRTPAIAREHGARVIRQEPRGYGVALERGLRAADRPVVVTTDCDDTYPMEALPRFLDEINDGADVVSGDRLSRGATPMPALNRLGNHAFALLASVLVGRRLEDTTTGMRAYRRSVVEAIEWTENTGLSAELLLRPVARGYDVRELPIDYRERAGETTLDPLRGGAAIAASILRVAVEERRR